MIRSKTGSMSSRRAARWIRALSLCAAVAVAGACHEVNLDFKTGSTEIDLFDDLYSISTVDDQHSVAVGYYGSVYYTADGGETWKKGLTDTIQSLYSVSMADAQHGWAVGMGGLILRTEDGGATWTHQPNLKEKEGSHLFAVTAIDSNRAWAIGSWGGRIFTEDAGKTWTDHSFTIDDKHPMFVWLAPVEQEKVRKGEKVYEDVGLNDIQCRRPPSTRCWLIGEFGYIFYSDDRGKTWERSTIEGTVEVPPINVGFNELELGPESVEVLSDFASQVAGEEHLNVAIESVASAREIREFGNPEDPTELFEILEARSQEARTVLEDAGVLSDRLRMRGQPPWDYEDFLEDDPEFLNRYLETRTANQPGIRVRVLQNPYLFTVRFRDDENGMIAGLGGVILVTSDGGKSWVYRKIDRKQALFSAVQVAGRAVAVGEKGLVRVSTDNGANWVPPDAGTFPEIFTYMRDVSFSPSGKVGFIVGQRGQILRSQDAGFQWEQVLPVAENDSTT